jgi:hypothetical protein
MKRILALAGGSVLALTVLSCAMGAKAAELAAPNPRLAKAEPPCIAGAPCNPTCVDHYCRPRCPDGYSCYPLYGAYGPYGGIAFWDAYTGSAFGYRRW